MKSKHVKSIRLSAHLLACRLQRNTTQLLVTTIAPPKDLRLMSLLHPIVLMAFSLSFVWPAIGIAIEYSQEPSSISPEEREFFEKQVRPILVKRCFECHGGSANEGGLSLASRSGWMKGGESGPVLEPGSPNSSLLIDAINHKTLIMPPEERGGKLPSDEIAVLTKWVEMGAPDPRTGDEVIGGMTLEEARSWWAFQPIPRIPVQDHTNDVQHIDDLLRSKLEQHGLKLRPHTDRRTLLRRLSYGLTGLPPTLEELNAFAIDSTEISMLNAINRLLESPQYGVHWGRRWLDVVRYADTAGENADHPLPHAWRYRNWVMDAMQRDMPYQDFVRMQIAGDLLSESADPEKFSEGIVATGYLAIARRFGHDSDKDMYLTHEDIIDNIGKSFLGLTISCARCHDHKYDPISAEDYYALYGILESTKFAFPGCEAKGRPRDLVPMLPKSKIDELLKPWQEKVAAIEFEKQKRNQAAESHRSKIKESWGASKVTLSETLVPEGASHAFESKVTVRTGESIVLAVKPNENHGADSSLIEWTIQELSGDSKRSWSSNDLIDVLTNKNPLHINGATLSLVELVDNSPSFLNESANEINGRRELKKWSIGDTPSVFVNTAEQAVDVWTSLAPRSFFVHPGTKSSVAVIWTSPIDGELLLSGRVADAHPAALDGVTFELSHIASGEMSTELLALGSLTTNLPEAGPAPSIPVAYGVVDAQPKNARLHERGDPEKLGAEVSRRWLTIFGGNTVDSQSSSGRRELGNWIAESPIAARVMVNRIWEWHFGTGLVKSSSDFGTRGEVPTHPELLDFLTARFIQSGYSIKAMHRLILQTDAYQRRSDAPDQNDTDNRWLSHFSRRRLTAEEIRDSLLMASGQLDLERGSSHPFPAESTWSFTQHQPFNANYETNKRSAFIMVQRQRRHPYLALFDGADPNASTANRQTTTVPTQALYFINDPFFHTQANLVAEEIVKSKRHDERIVAAYERLFQREPSKLETDRCSRFLENYPGSEAQRWSALARVLLASSEFLYVD